MTDTPAVDDTTVLAEQQPGDDALVDAGDPPASDRPASDIEDYVDYSTMKKAELEQEVAARNAARDDDSLVIVAAPCNKAELIAALQADDAGDPGGQAAGPNPFSQLVRVRIGDGPDAVDTNMGRILAESTDGITVLADQPISAPDGRLLGDTHPDGRPVKPKTTVADAAAAKKAASSSADDSKEQS